MEGQCHSGQHHDCHGSANLVSCCQGHYEGSDVGPTSQCTWEYFDHGQQMECGRSDEIIAGRCGSGMNKGEDRPSVNILSYFLRLSWILLPWQPLL